MSIILSLIVFIIVIREFLIKHVFHADRTYKQPAFSLKRYTYVDDVVQLESRELFSVCKVDDDKDCHNINYPLDIRKHSGEQIRALPPSNSQDKGYIIPHEDIGEFSCTPALGTAVLVIANYEKLVNGMSSSLQLFCHCKYPQLMTNVNGGIMTDCTQINACRNGGILSVPKDDDNKYKDPLLFGRCTCPLSNTVEYHDTDTGPECRFKTVRDLSVEEHSDLFLGYKKTVPYILENKFIDPSFIGEFSSDVAQHLPNPCLYDYKTGKRIPTYEVEIMLLKDIATCVILKLNSRYVSMITDTDYLKNNNGRYPNAVFDVLDTENTKNAITVPAFYFPSYLSNKPIFGTMVVPWADAYFKPKPIYDYDNRPFILKGENFYFRPRLPGNYEPYCNVLKHNYMNDKQLKFDDMCESTSIDRLEFDSYYYRNQYEYYHFKTCNEYIKQNWTMGETDITNRKENAIDVCLAEDGSIVYYGRLAQGSMIFILTTVYAKLPQRYPTITPGNVTPGLVHVEKDQDLQVLTALFNAHNPLPGKYRDIDYQFDRVVMDKYLDI